jgi:hypothetical protein
MQVELEYTPLGDRKIRIDVDIELDHLRRRSQKMQY